MKYFGSLEAGGTKMVCAVGDEQGNLIRRFSTPTLTPEQTMPVLLDFFRAQELSALGIGCFGPVDLRRDSPTYGSITTTPKLAWRDYPIVQVFQDALGLPVGFDTDVNAAALGEATWGCTRGLANSIYITVGTGIGVGVIVDGKPYHGMLHPEGGHMLLGRLENDPLERGICPYHGDCLEGLASGPAIAARWGRPGAELSGRPEVWELEAGYLAQAICNYVMVLSPERIVVGGGVAHQNQLLPLVRWDVERRMGGYITAGGMADLEGYIVEPSLNDNQGVLGGLKLAMDVE